MDKDGSFALSGSSLDGTLTGWDLNAISSQFTVPRPAGVLGGVIALAQAERSVVAAYEDGSLALWSLLTGESTKLGEHKGGPPMTIILCPNGNTALSQTSTGRMLWDLTRHCALPGLPPPDYSDYRFATLSPDGCRIACSLADEVIRVWDIVNNKWIVEFHGDQTWSWCAWAEGKLMAVDETGTIHILAWEE
jgi:WD40 repeat protein